MGVSKYLRALPVFSTAIVLVVTFAISAPVMATHKAAGISQNTARSEGSRPELHSALHPADDFFIGQQIGDTIAQIELSLRKKDPDLHWGVISDALHHLYCWVQIDAVLPWGKKALWDELEEVRDCLKQDDRDGAMATLTRVINQINADGKEPQFD